VANVVEEDSALVSVEFIQNAISAHSQLKLASALESVMRKSFEAGSHVVNFALDRIADRRWQGIEGSRKRGRPNLEGGRHNLTRLSGRELSRCDFAPRLIQLGFHVIRQFKIVLETFIDPIANLLEFGPGQLGNCCLDFFDRAHRERLIDSRDLESSTSVGLYRAFG
jgi:hypothetical protein